MYCTLDTQTAHLEEKALRYMPTFVAEKKYDSVLLCSEKTVVFLYSKWLLIYQRYSFTNDERRAIYCMKEKCVKVKTPPFLSFLLYVYFKVVW